MIHHVYANQSNVGDWLSARGIQTLLRPWQMVRHLCDEPFVEETLDALGRTGPEDFIIIGGGGLLMDYFLPFWKGFRGISERTPFAVWGAGCCDLKREHTRPPAELISEILGRARSCVVRDELTRTFLKRLPLPPPIACPAINAVGPIDGAQLRLLHVDHYDVVGAEVYERMGQIAQKFAAETGRSYGQTNNLIPAGHQGALQRILDLYASADLVLTSRLHGCIIALAMGRRVLAVSGDHKVESFMQAAGLADWVCDRSDIESVGSRLKRLEEQALPGKFLATQRRLNEEFAQHLSAFLFPRATTTMPA